MRTAFLITLRVLAYLSPVVSTWVCYKAGDKLDQLAEIAIGTARQIKLAENLAWESGNIELAKELARAAGEVPESTHHAISYALVGFLIGLIVLVLLEGARLVSQDVFELKTRAESARSGVDPQIVTRLEVIEHKLSGLTGESLMETVRRFGEVNEKLDELNEGLAAVLEETLKRLDSIEKKVEH